MPPTARAVTVFVLFVPVKQVNALYGSPALPLAAFTRSVAPAFEASTFVLVKQASTFVLVKQASTFVLVKPALAAVTRSVAPAFEASRQVSVFVLLY
jgi:hypothetical protein